MFSRSISYINYNKRTVLNRLENEISSLYKIIKRDYEQLKDQVEDYFMHKDDELKSKLKLAKEKLYLNNQKLPIEMYRQNTFLDPFKGIIDKHLDFEPNVFMKQFTLNGIMEITNHKNNLKFERKIDQLICTENSIILLLKHNGINNYNYMINEYSLNKDILINHSVWITHKKISYNIAANTENIYLLEKETGNLYFIILKKFIDPEEPKLFTAVSITCNETSLPICCIVPFQKGKLNLNRKKEKFINKHSFLFLFLIFHRCHYKRSNYA